MSANKLTEWEAGNDLCAACDYLGEKEQELALYGYAEHAKLLRDCRVKIAKFFNDKHKLTHSFGLGPTERRKK